MRKKITPARAGGVAVSTLCFCVVLLLVWLPSLDSNRDYLIQSQACYHYTTRQSLKFNTLAACGSIPSRGQQPRLPQVRRPLFIRVQVGDQPAYRN